MNVSRTSFNLKKFLRVLREKGKTFPELPKSLKQLQEEASTKGLDNATLRMVAEVLRNIDLGANNSISLIKCMIPRDNIEDDEIKKLISWFLSIPAPVTTLSMLLQWIIGCLEYQLLSRNSIYIFYDPLFYVMLKQSRLEPRLAQLIYLITKPEDVTRRHVIRLLKLNANYRRPQKHITALLSLFKSYKPEFVPEKIPAINIQSIWRSIPDVLRLGFEDARERVISRQTLNDDKIGCDWNVFAATKSKKNQEPLVPSVGYFNIGSALFKNETEKSVFDVTTATDLGKHHIDLKLPCNATSLLTNHVGYHLLTYTNFEYQQRFMHNLYYTLWRSFIFENGKYSNEEMNKILDMTIEFSRYMQHGISIVNFFMNEYLSSFRDEYDLKLLALMQWSSASIPELQNHVLKHLKLMFYSSPLTTKCRIIRTLRALLLNLLVINNDSFKDKTFPFLGQSFIGGLPETVKMIENVVKELITTALNIHFYDSAIISEALSFYEQINELEIYKTTSFVILAPPTVIYGSFLSRSCALVSSVCALLLQYRKHLKENKSSVRSIQWLIIHVEDLVSALWYDNCFSNRLGRNRYFLQRLSSNTLKNNTVCDLNSLLNISNHLAVLPYLYMLSTKGLVIKTKENANNVAAHYYVHVNQFIDAVLGN